MSTNIPKPGSMIVVKIGGRFTHRVVIKRKGRLVFRDRGGFSPLDIYAQKNIGEGVTVWQEP